MNLPWERGSLKYRHDNCYLKIPNTKIKLKAIFCLYLGVCGILRRPRCAAHSYEHIRYHHSCKPLSAKRQLKNNTDMELNCSYHVYFNQIQNLKERGMEFMSVPDTYYEQLRQNLQFSKVKVKEDLDVLQVRLISSCRELLIFKMQIWLTFCLF